MLNVEQRTIDTKPCISASIEKYDEVTFDFWMENGDPEGAQYRPVRMTLVSDDEDDYFGYYYKLENGNFSCDAGGDTYLGDNEIECLAFLVTNWRG